MVQAHPYSSLPVALTSFIGREREMADVVQLLTWARLVSLVSIGGCGKTRLALRVAHESSARFADGVCWVELARLTDPALVPQAVAKALGISEQPDTPVLDVLLERIRAKNLLLVLDNCEHVLGACAQLVEAILRGTDVTLVTTSREPLGVEGEMIYQVPPLTLPTTQPQLADMNRFDAVRLFVERARSVRHDFTLTPANANVVIEICRRLDGIPLAIELASARIGVLSASQILERLDDRLDLLAAPTRADERHRTLRAAVDWSYTLLAPDEQRLLQRLSIFASGFSLSMVESACGWGDVPHARMLDLLSSLVHKSLVVAEMVQGSEARYRLLETIRQYAGEKLFASGERAEASDHFLNCYARVADEIAPKLFGRFQQVWFIWLEAEHANFRVALAWALEALEAKRIESGLRIASALYQFWLTRDYVREGFTWFSRLLGQSDDSLSLAVHVNALAYATFLALFLSDATAATAWSGRAMALCEAAGEEGRPLRGFAMASVSSALETAGDPQAAYANTERQIEIERELSDPFMLGMALFVQGMRAIRLGKVEAARAYLNEAMAGARSGGDPYRVAHVLNAMGDLAHVEGRFAQAASLYEQSLAGSSAVWPTRSCGRKI